MRQRQGASQSSPDRIPSDPNRVRESSVAGCSSSDLPATRSVQKLANSRPGELNLSRPVAISPRQTLAGRVLSDPQTSRREQLTADLRRVADFLDSRPEIPVPLFVDIPVHPQHDASSAPGADALVESERIAAELGCTMKVHGGHYTATRTFGLVTYKAVVITPNAMARHAAWWSYQDSLSPDIDGRCDLWTSPCSS